jgi:TolB-like protein
LSFFEELKRRNVFRVGIAYVLFSWVLLQGADFAFDLIDAPNWVIQALFTLVALGLPGALIFAWVFEMTPEGIKLEKDIVRERSVTPQTGRKLDRVIIIMLVLAVAVLLAERFLGVEKPVSNEAASQVATKLTPSGQAGPTESPAGQSVAVLPFVAFSNGPDDGYFADGLTEEILNSLAQLPELLVTARTSAFSFKGQDMPVQDIAARLGVEHIVEGSVRRAGERVRITAQLIRASDGFHLWSETYDRTLEDIFAAQEDIATSIAETLDVVLDEEKLAAMRNAGIGDVEAFIAFQKGVDAYEQAHRTNKPLERLQESIRWLDRALEIVPDIDAAWYLRTDYFGHVLLEHAAGEDEFPEDELEEALNAIHDGLSRAARVAKNEPLRAILNAESMIFTDDWSQIPPLLEKAYETGYCNPVNWLAEFTEPYGYASLIAEQGLETMRCDPMSGWRAYATAWGMLWDGRSEEALQVAEDYLERAPFHPWVDDVRFFARLLMDPAVSDPAMFGPTPEGSNFVVPRAFFAHAYKGDVDTALSLLEEWKKTHTIDDSTALVTAVAVGNRSEANRLARLIDDRPGGLLALSVTVSNCRCGAPFDLEVAPNYQRGISQAGFHWPPTTVIKYPAKDW